MAWPTPQDYNEAIQNPKLNFSDLELKNGQPELTRLGLPRPISGAFATVYRMECGQKTFAVRCFTSEVPDQQQRYAAISHHLNQLNLPYTVAFNFVPQGILIRGQWYPVLKMEWIEGESLDVYVRRHLRDSRVLSGLAEQWMKLVTTLQMNGLAHGDLQHGNILVTGDQFKLIDYDGMFVPALFGLSSHETGHRNYQSPQRTNQDFGPYLDNFSAWVIYVSLLALSIDPQLWNKTKAGDENLLFRQQDFEAPSQSLTFRLLASHTDSRLRSLGHLFESVIFASPAQVPHLSAPPGWSSSSPTPAPSSPPTSTSPIPTSSIGAGWIQDHLSTTAPNRVTPVLNTPAKADSSNQCCGFRGEVHGRVT